MPGTPMPNENSRGRRLAAPLDARHERVPHAASVEIDSRDGLRRQQRLVARAGEHVAVDGDLVERRAGRRRGRDQRLRDAIFALVVGVARLNVEANRIADAMQHLRARDVGVGLEIVALESVEAIARGTAPGACRATASRSPAGRPRSVSCSSNMSCVSVPRPSARLGAMPKRSVRAPCGLRPRRRCASTFNRNADVSPSRPRPRRDPPSRARSRRCRR